MVSFNYYLETKVKNLLNKLLEPILKWMGFEIVEKGDEVLEDQYKIENGYGTYTSPGGDKYVGEFKDGKFHGAYFGRL